MPRSEPVITRGLRAIAAMEAFKGALVLLAGFGLLALVHRDAQALAEALVGHLHLNPARGTPRIFLALAANLTNQRLWGLASLASAYAGLRFAEAYGLWHGRAWAEWLGAVSGAIYVPIEVYELVHGVSSLKLVTLAANLIVVAYLVWALLQRRRPAAPVAGIR